jgi:hypothetical protein
MSFVVRTQKSRINKPDGHYILFQNREFLIQEITISASGRVCLKMLDPIRMEYQLLQVCSLENLMSLHPDFQQIIE